MVTVLRIEGLRVVIDLNDHLPAHVHVFAGGGEAKVNLLGVDDAPELVWADRLTRAEVRLTMRVVVEHCSMLLQRWEGIHGRVD